MGVNRTRRAVPEWLAPILATVNRPDYQRDTVIFHATWVLAMVLGGILLTAAIIAFDLV